MLLLFLACDPYGPWPDPESVYPYVVSEEELEPWERTRWEDGTWDQSDAQQLAYYVQKAYNHRKGAPVETLEHFARQRTMPSVQPGITLGIAGDIMYVDQDDWSTWAEPSAVLLEGVDLRVGNLETPTSPDHPTEPRALGLYAFNAPPAMLDSLPFDVLQVNNNHSLDAGDDGLEATVDAIEARGMQATGVDTHTRVGDVQLLSYTWGLNDGRTSDRHELFVVPFGSADPVPLGSLLDEVRNADAEHVVVLLHWGYEFEYYPDVRFMQMAREIVAAGADVVAGHGPHVVQPAELCFVNHPEHVPGVGTCSVRDDGPPRTAAVLYSLGDFGSEVITIPARVGIVATVSLDAQGVTGLSWAGAATTFEGGVRIQPLSEVDDPDYQAEAARLEAHLGRW